jgi:hypothetical protein
MDCPDQIGEQEDRDQREKQEDKGKNELVACALLGQKHLPQFS